MTEMEEGDAQVVKPHKKSAIALQEYLQGKVRSGGQVDITVNTIDDAIKVAEANSRNEFRKLILRTLVPSMSIIPVVLILLLVFPGFGLPDGKLRSEAFQLSLLAAIAGDIFGLYVIITRNLFPTTDQDANDDP